MPPVCTDPQGDRCLVGTWGTEYRADTITVPCIELLVSLRSKTNTQETIWKWYKLPSLILSKSQKQRSGWEKCTPIPLELFTLHRDPQFALFLFYRSRTLGRRGKPFAFRTLDYQDQYCFLFSFPLGCQKYPGKVSDSCISLSELGLGLETRGSVRS